ncbi:hypothetical protein QRQ56_25435 [Bradyrhizobium sp. U531]|uniref:hypothetical protein n=1 Tax=Bradyrhizobium sp. U531 TaxID=3053458 RepID=UPI003F43ADE4
MTQGSDVAYSAATRFAKLRGKNGARVNVLGAGLWGVLDAFLFLGFASFVAWNLYLLAMEPLATTLVWTLLLSIGAVNLFGLVLAVRKNKLVYTAIFYFNLVFFSVAPTQQIRNRFDPIFADLDLLQDAVLMVLVWSILCLIGLRFATRPRAWRSAVPPVVTRQRPLPTLWLASASATAIGCLVVGSSLFSDRETAGKIITSQVGQVGGLLFVGAIFPFACYAAIVGMSIAVKGRNPAAQFAFATAIAGSLVLNNFLILSRYQFSVLVFAGVLFLFNSERAGSRILLSLLGVGTIVAPLFNVFRTGTSLYLGNGGFDMFLTTMDYDAFSLLCHTLRHVETSGIDGGWNIVSGILFFVPRNVWPGKNEITPYYLIDTLRAYRGLWNYNLSEPLIAEGFFAWGAVGAVAIAVAFLALVNRLEGPAIEQLSIRGLFRCASPIIVLMVLRGSFMVGMSIIVGHFVAVSLSIWLAKGSSRRSSS